MTGHPVADLLDLGEQVRRDEHRAAVGGELADEGAHLPGALRVEPVGRLVEDEQVAGPQQRGGKAEALLHAERVGAEPLARGRAEPHPVERRLDARTAGARVDGEVGRVQSGEVRPAGQVRVEGGSLDERAHPRQHPGARGRHGFAQQLDGAVRRGDQARAASGSWSSCPTRSGRGSP
jgi:hypothetical protein